MTVADLYNELAFLIAEGKGDYEVGYDDGACRIYDLEDDDCGYVDLLGQ